MPWISSSIVFFSYLLQANTFALPLESLQAVAASTDSLGTLPVSLTYPIPPPDQHPTLSPSSPLHKRTARLLNDCPPFTHFLESSCSHATSPQAYTLLCRNHTAPRYEVELYHRCHLHEICIDIAPPQHGYFPRAYCLTRDNYLQTARILAADTGTVASSILVQFETQAGRRYALGGMVTSPDGSRTVNSSSLSIQALGLDGRFHPPGYRALRGGGGKCAGCGEVGVAPVPPGTRKVRVHAVLEGQAAREGGVLVLASLEL